MRVIVGVKFEENTVGTGKLISFEGIDGSGKSTQCELLRRWLDKQNISYLMTREPGGTVLGNEIRQMLLHRLDYPPITALAEVFLFQADRAQHFATYIVPALSEGKIVVTDRCIDSSVVYQGIGRGVGVELIETLSRLATGSRVPDLTILLDIDHLVARERLDEREMPNRLDRENDGFYRRLRTAYLDQAQLYPQRIHVFDGTQNSQSIHKQIVLHVQNIVGV